MLVPEYSSMLIEMLCYQQNRLFFFFLSFVALIIIFLVYHKLISNHKAPFVVVLDFCFLGFPPSPPRGRFYLLVCLITLAILAWEAHLTNSFLWLPGFTGGRRLLFPNSPISV